MRLIALIGLLISTLALMADAQEEVQFNRDIRPILSDKCFQCHGPDEHSREADLRFDIQDDAMHVIEPGDPDSSDLFYRILSDDEGEQMPPPEINKPLKKVEIELLRKWIEQGAKWSDFWAYVPPTKHLVPDSRNFDASANWIDQMVSARLEKSGMQLSPSADKVTLIRRAYFDLIGLPPTPDQVANFVNDNSENAFEKVVDELLASPHFGERLAMYWLDLVRYADTVGYHGDQDHNITPYRDWVINAFNSNMPFDQFTREQLAGDLISNSTVEQKIASGYNRLLQTTHEGGLQPKEYSAIYAADRVRNVSIVWMGATVGCAQCHDHKYDPYTSRVFYSLAAFFADVDDEKHFKAGTNSLPTKRPPEILIISDADRKELDKANAQVADLKNRINTKKKQLAAARKAESRKSETLKTKSEPDAERDDAKKGGVETAGNDDCDLPIGEPSDPDSSDEIQKQINQLEKELKSSSQSAKTIESRGRWSMITSALEKPRTTRVLPRGNWLDETGPIVQPSIPEFMGDIEPENKRAENKRANRLDLANWFTDATQTSGKLTARVMANRFWYLYMGVGISKSLDDFGGQGEAPAYPELLDNLAIEFVESGWDTKSLIRQIVTSKTYQQSSLTTPELQERDPFNQLFARQSRFRLPAEIVRDNALAISGLLVDDQVGGKSAKPYQPGGYYQHLNFPTRKYAHDRDQNQWRRGVYVHWQRQFLHPTLKALDAPSREECTAQRPKSNTPSAALALLNDPSFVEAARVFAARVLNESSSADFGSRLEFAFQWALSRKPEPIEITILQKLLDENLVSFNEDLDTAKKLISIGESPVGQNSNPAELAAWTMVARAILNTSESMTRN